MGQTGRMRRAGVGAMGLMRVSNELRASMGSIVFGASGASGASDASDASDASGGVGVSGGWGARCEGGWGEGIGREEGEGRRWRRWRRIMNY